MNLPIIKITIVQGFTGTDKILLQTSLPGSVYPFNEALGLAFSCAKSTGPKYVAEHFPGVPVEVIERTFHAPSFSHPEPETVGHHCFMCKEECNCGSSIVDGPFSRGCHGCRRCVVDGPPAIDGLQEVLS